MRVAYEAVEGWGKLPEGWSFSEVVGVAVDSRDRVHVFCRGKRPVLVFDREGVLLDAWGEGRFVRPHGIFIDRQDRLYLVDDEGHRVHRFGPDGAVQLTLGDGRPSDTGYVPGRHPVTQAAGPFNTVTNVATGPDGDLFVADGYGNARIHRFSPDGRLLRSWGEPGSGPGQLNLPHGVAVDRAGRVLVADRENSRIQVFTGDGDLLDIWTWPSRPCDVAIGADETVYVAELGFLVGNPTVPHLRLMQTPPPGHPPIARVTAATPDGQVIAHVGGDDPVKPGNFVAPHGICVDPRGALYIGEVVVATGAVQRMHPFTPRCLQKLARR